MIEVPFALALHPNGVENAPNAFREAGLHARLRAHDVVRTEVPPYRQLRDTATQILNPQAIALLAARVADAVTAALDDAAFPIVLGGDCSLLLGPLLALCRRGRYGLAFINGHADFWHPSDEPTGEAASLDLATGRGPTILTNIEKRRPLVRDEDVALIGHRAFGDNDHFLGEHVRDTAITIADLPQIRQLGSQQALERATATLTQPELEGFWVHFDVELRPRLFPAPAGKAPTRSSSFELTIVG